MTNPIYFTQKEIISKFGTYLSEKTLLGLSNISAFCSFFNEPVFTIKISEKMVSHDGNPVDREKEKEKLKQMMYNKLFDNMLYLIEDRQKKIDNYNKSNVFNKVLHKISEIVTNDDKNSNDPEYIQKGINFLKLKTIEDIKNKIEFTFEEIESVENMIAVPEHFDIIKNAVTLYSIKNKITNTADLSDFKFKDENVIKENLKEKEIVTHKVNSISLTFINNDNPYIMMSFISDGKTFFLDLVGEEFLLTERGASERAFFNNIDAIDHAIKENNKKVEKMKKEIEFIEYNNSKLNNQKNANLIELK